MIQNIDLGRIKSIIKKYSSLLAGEKNNVINTETMLHEYVSTGIFSSSRGFPDVTPEYQLWESTYLNAGLNVLGNRSLHSLEFSCANGKEFDIDLAGNSVMYVYYSQLIIQHIYALQRRRFGTRGAGRIGMDVVPYTVLALLIGQKGIANKMFLLLLKLYENDGFIHREYPIYCFMLNLLSVYFDKPSVILSGNIEDDILFQHLLDEWKNPDYERLNKLCVDACDYHLTRCKPDKGSNWYEFSSLSWSLWPIEINLLFKLREMLGLNNPNVNHPLMNTALGQLPTEKEFVMDDLLLQVLEKMHGQGFDENEVFEKIFSESF